MNKLLKYGLLTTIILVISLAVAYAIFINTFQIFKESKSKIIQAECDYEGIRQATVYEFGGNAATVPLISVSVNNGCGKSSQDENKKVIFSAEYNGGSNVNVKWLSFDSLQISYSKNLAPNTLIDKVTYKDSSLNVNVIFIQTGFEKNQSEMKDSIKVEEAVYVEYLGRQLTMIRKKLIPLTSTTQWVSIDKRKIETKNGAAIYYFLKGELQKIRFIQNTDTTERFIEYYLDNDNLFFAFERQSDSIGLKNDPEYYEPFEDSLFFEKGELIRIKSNMDCGAPFAEDYRKEEQKRLKKEFKQLFNQLKNE